MERAGSFSASNRMLRVLQAVADAPDAVGVAEIAATTGIDRAEVHLILSRMAGEGFVSAEPGTGLYRTASAAAGLRNQAQRRSRLRDAAMPAVEELARTTRETVTLSARHGYERSYVAQVESAQEPHITVVLGERVPLVSGANGLAILAFLPESDVEQVLRLPRPRFTAVTVTDETSIRERIAQTRAQGWASTTGERVKDSFSIAAPILAPDGRPAGSISVAYIAERATAEIIAALPELVLDAASDAARRLAAMLG